MNDHPVVDEPPWVAEERAEAEHADPTWWERAGPPSRNGTARTPPHSLDAEASLLGAMLLAPAAIDAAAGLVDTADFYAPHHRLTHTAIVALHTRGEGVDPITVAAALEEAGHLDDVGGLAALTDLSTSTPSTSNAAHYARIVAERAAMRRLIAAGTDIAELGWGLPGDLGEAVATARSRIERVAETTRTPADRLITGGTFLLDQPPEPPAVWGEGGEVLWAQGETLLIVGPTGVGKTTVAAQLLEGLVVGDQTVLGWPVQRCERRILYLAMDRPAQIARAVARTLRDVDRDLLDARLLFWRGPLPHDLGSRPETLVELCMQAGVGAVFIDSLKDAAVKINTDEVGGNLNRSLQLCLAEGIDVCASHHHRKAERGTSKAPTTIDELFGSSLIPSGAGSVIQLWGAPGDLVVSLTHLKQPAEQVGPLQIAHDHTAGRSTVTRGYDVVAALRNAPKGLTTIEVARQMFELGGAGEVKENLRKKAERRLRSAADRGLVTSPEGPERGGPGGQSSRRWYAVEHRHDDH